MRTTTTLVAVAMLGLALGALTAVAIPADVLVGDRASQPQVSAVLLGAVPPSPVPAVATEPVVDREAPPAGEGVPVAPGPTPSVLPVAGEGTFTVAAGTSPVVGEGELLRFSVETEDGSGVSASEFARMVEVILFDPRSWIGGEQLALQRVSAGPVDFTVTLATPTTVDFECRPLTTNGTYSCWNGERTMLNLWRWYDGAVAYGRDIAGYRRYLVNHEVGHALGQPHEGCPGAGHLAPVMMQQTISVEACVPSPWPYPEAGSRPARTGPIA